MFEGKKTYIIAILGTVYAISAYFTGHIDMNQFAQLLETSLGLGALRSALTYS